MTSFLVGVVLKTWNGITFFPSNQCYLFEVIIAGLVKALHAVNGTAWHSTFLGLWVAALRLVQRVGIDPHKRDGGANELWEKLLLELILVYDVVILYKYSQSSLKRPCCMSFTFYFVCVGTG